MLEKLLKDLYERGKSTISLTPVFAHVSSVVQGAEIDDKYTRAFKKAEKIKQDRLAAEKLQNTFDYYKL